MPPWSEASSPEDGRRDRLHDVGHGRLDALAVVARLVAVAQLDRLVGAGGGTGGHGRPAHGAVVQDDGHLDGRVAARVEDLLRVDVVDVGHQATTSGCAVLQDLDARQLAALEELERGAAAGGDVREARRQAELLDGGHGVAAADHHGGTGLRAIGQEARHGARAVAEGGHLEDAQRAVPEDRLRVRQGRLEGHPRLGTDVHRRPRVGDLLDGHDLVLGAAGDLLGHHDVRGQEQVHAALDGAGHDALGVLDAVALEQGLAHAQVLCRQEGVGHAATDDELVDPVEERLEDLDLVGDLGPADDRCERPRRVLQQAGEVADLALHEQARVGGQDLRHAHRGGVGAVRRAEGVVDVDVAVAGQRRREAGVVGLLLVVEAEVLQEQQLTGLEAVDGIHGPDADGVTGGRHGPLEELGEVLGHGAQAQRVADLALRPSEVAHEHDGGAVLEQVGDGGEGGADAGVVPHPAVLDGHVEVDPHEDALALRIEVTDGELVHVRGLEVMASAAQASFSAMSLTRSATRQL